MDKALKILALLGGVIMLVAGIRWIVDPSGAAEFLRMSLQDGPGRNSQIGDTTSFFLCIGGFAIYGVWKEKRDFIIAALALLLGVAVFRVLAGMVHDAPIIWNFVVFEVVVSAIWYSQIRKLQS